MAYGFDWLYVRRFARLHQILFPGFCSHSSLLFALLMTVAVGEQFLAYRVGLISGEFYKVLGQRKSLDEFKTVALKALGIVLGMSVIKSTRAYLARLLLVAWRSLVNTALHRIYFTSIRYYQINVLEASTLDNPDQRMTADILLLCTKYSSIIVDLILAPFLIAYYSYSAFSRSGWVGPTGMFILFFVSTIINKFLMSPIVNLTAAQEHREGDFRFKHVQVRTYAESLAFYQSSPVEARKVDERLGTLCHTQRELYKRNLFLDLAINTFDYLGGIASYLIIAIPIFSGAYDDLDPSEIAQVVSENAFVCIYLAFQFSKLIGMSGTVSNMAGATHRIMELAEKLAHLNKRLPDSHRGSTFKNGLTDSSYLEPGVVFKLIDVSVAAPGLESSMLVKHLNLRINLKENLLISGKSSSGKSSILRTIRGLWPPVSGSIIQQKGIVSNVFFLPQKPFFTDGSLREQIVYPLVVDEFAEKNCREDAWILERLEHVGMSDLVNRCGGDLDTCPNFNWHDMLSPGEMQRLAFIRLFYHTPQVAFLDEATSAISVDIEEILYEHCDELGITLISVGHRDTLRKFHQKVLRIGLEDGAWTLEDI